MSAPELPPHLYGKTQRHDLGLGLVMSAARAFTLATARIPLRRPLVSGSSDAMVLDVLARTEETADGSVVSVVLGAGDGAPLPRWWPGAHLDVHLPSGRMRTYSLCGDVRDRTRYRIAVRRIADGGGGSIEAHDVLQVGASVIIRGPRNAFPFAPPGSGSDARRVHFVAGGIGITPILSMIALCHARGIDWSLVYAGRDRESLPFLTELEQFGDRVTIRTDEVHGIPGAGDLMAGVEAGDAVYCCGPPPMIGLVRDAVRALPGTELHVERFSPPPVVDGHVFTVELARSGETVEIPADLSVLDAVREGRPQIAYSCRQGFCGTCVVRVVDGEPEHRDTILTEAQRADGQVLICVSRAAAGSHLTLDV